MIASVDQILSVNVEGIPAELRSAPRWLSWIATPQEKDDGTTYLDKTPCSGKDSRATGKTNDPNTWGTFDQAIATLRRGGVAGIGFALCQGFVGVDIDDCRDLETGTLTPAAAEIVRKLNTYTEVSPSGTGVKAFLLGSVAAGRKNTADGVKVEIYGSQSLDGAKYFTVTGHRLPGSPHAVAEIDGPRRAELNRLFEQFNSKSRPKKSAPSIAPTPKLPTGAEPTDAEVLEQARRKSDFAKLFDTPTGTAGEDQSSVDLALANYLAFYCGDNPAQITRLMRQSARHRDKFDRDDYMDRTIGKALDGRSEFYDWSRRRSQPIVVTGVHARPAAPVDHDPGEVDPEEHATDDGADGLVRCVLEPGQAGRKLDQVMKAVASELYVADDALVNVTIDPRLGSLRIRPVTAEWVQRFLDGRVEFLRMKKDGELMPADCPQALARQVVKLGDYQTVRRIDGVSNGPFIMPDGTIGGLKSGYDAASRIMVHTDREWPEIPEVPSLSDAQAAADTLLRLVDDFPFAGNVSRAAWLAALLTAVGRHAFDGPAPLFLADASKAGSGKTLTQQAIAIIANGAEVETLQLGSTADETRKLITSAMCERSQLILFDNSSGSIGDHSLDRLLTSRTYSDRKLGTNTTAKFENRLVILANGNNLVIAGDLVRRCIRWRLEPDVENPELCQFGGRPFLEQVRDRRPELLAAALTILRYRIRGQGVKDAPSMASFEGWSRLVRTAVMAVTLSDPVMSQSDLSESDMAACRLAELLAAIHAIKRGGTWTARSLITDAFEGAWSVPEEIERLREAISDACDSVGTSSRDGTRANRLGLFLRGRRGTIAGGLQLAMSDTRTRVGMVWHIVERAK